MTIETKIVGHQIIQTLTVEPEGMANRFKDGNVEKHIVREWSFLAQMALEEKIRLQLKALGWTPTADAVPSPPDR